MNNERIAQVSLLRRTLLESGVAQTTSGDFDPATRQVPIEPTQNWWCATSCR